MEPNLIAAIVMLFLGAPPGPAWLDRRPMPRNVRPLTRSATFRSPCRSAGYVLNAGYVLTAAAPTGGEYCCLFLHPRLHVCLRARERSLPVTFDRTARLYAVAHTGRCSVALLLRSQRTCRDAVPRQQWHTH